MKHSIAASLVFIFIIFQHFQFTSLGSYPLTIGLFAGLAAISIVTSRAPLIPLSLVWSGIIAISGLTALLNPETDGRQFVQTLLLVLLASAIVMIGLFERAGEFARSPQFARALFCALVLVVVFSLAQVVTGALGSVAFFNPFGSNQYLYQYNPNIEFTPIPRAQGFYLEPSYAAFVIGSTSLCLIALRKFLIASAVLCFVGLLACQSATGLFVFVAIALVTALRSGPRVVIAACVLALGAIWLAGPSLLKRITSLGESSSSANYRLIAPLEVISDLLSSGPLGYPLGSISEVMSSYNLQNGAEIGSSLDNGFYVLVYYFGWPGLIALFIWGLATMRFTFLGSRQVEGLAWLIPFWLLACMFFSGGIVLPEFALSLWLAISCMTETKKTIGNVYAGFTPASGSVAQHRHGYGQRSGRPVEHAEIA